MNFLVNKSKNSVFIDLKVKTAVIFEKYWPQIKIVFSHETFKHFNKTAYFAIGDSIYYKNVLRRRLLNLFIIC